MQYLLYILSIPFLYFNYKIIISDLKNKIIPNKYLGYLLLLIPFYYIYIFLNFPDINYLLFLGQIILTFIISFTLYYFGVWAAGDAKYLLVLSLFIPYIGVIPFIGNIALITLAYLFIYFIYFYFGKILFNKIYRQSLWGNIKQDLSEKWKVHKGNKGGNTYKIVAKFLLIFFIIFVSIRLSRIYLLSELLDGGNSRTEILQSFIEKWNIYLIFLGIGIFLGGLYLFRLGINKLRFYIFKKLKINLELIGNIFIGILFTLLISFIIYELINDYKEISNLLFRIFTLYLGLYLIIKILIYSYKITFGVAEMNYIDIKDLKEGDIVDKEYLVKLFKVKNPKNKNSVRAFNKNYYYFNTINNPINYKTLIKLKSIYKKTNNICINDKNIMNSGFNIMKNIKILNTFSFSLYIFLGFTIVFLLGDKLIIILLLLITEAINNFTS